METYFKRDFATISFSNVYGAIIITWHLTPTSKEYREGMDTLIMALENFKVTKLVADATKIGAIHPDDQDWAVTNWRPRSRKAGHSHSAFVLADEVFTRIAVEDMMDQAEQTGETVHVKYFNKMEEALDWLIVQPQLNN